ncbi:hypothetical protein BDF14DRAFT_1834742 [Spinellus fusiger]|nr:hypothetical protein BDF14DRAFT_1834742 [Spinellus fusiger]
MEPQESFRSQNNRTPLKERIGDDSSLSDKEKTRRVSNSNQNTGCYDHRSKNGAKKNTSPQSNRENISAAVTDGETTTKLKLSHHKSVSNEQDKKLPPFNSMNKQI